MIITYDSEVDALYIELRHVKATDSMDVEEGVTIDLDDEGHIIGLEILDASERLGKEQLHNVTLKDLAWEPAKAES